MVKLKDETDVGRGLLGEWEEYQGQGMKFFGADLLAALGSSSSLEFLQEHNKKQGMSLNSCWLKKTKVRSSKETKENRHKHKQAQLFGS